jgi:hypothetical protein
MRIVEDYILDIIAVYQEEGDIFEIKNDVEFMNGLNLALFLDNRPYVVLKMKNWEPPL